MQIVDENRINNETTFYYLIPTPKFLEKREALVQKKTKRDFPARGNLAVLHKSVNHPDFPESNDITRLDIKINGMVFKDAPEVEGCKIEWVIQNDIKGSVPKQLVNKRAIQNSKITMEALSMACNQMLNGTLRPGFF